MLRVVEALYDAIPEQFHDMVESGYLKFVKTVSLPLILHFFLLEPNANSDD